MSTYFHYSAFGMAIRSGVELPELHATRGDETTGWVHVDVGPVPEALEHARHVAPAYQVAHDAFLLHVPEVARYYVRGGNAVTVAPEPAASWLNVRLFLLGSCVGALCHQRGLLPLHAAAIDLGGRCVAFAGVSGAGKSTLAAWFHDRGHTILSDDLCAVSLTADGALGWPGAPRIKLWRDAVDALGHRDTPVQPAWDGHEKYHLPLHASPSATPLPLARLYVLDDGGGPPGITRLTGTAALNALMVHTYCPYHLDLMGGKQAHFNRCLQLLSFCEVYQLQRRRGFEVFAEEMAVVEAHALADAPQP